MGGTRIKRRKKSRKEKNSLFFLVCVYVCVCVCVYVCPTFDAMESSMVDVKEVSLIQ